MGNVSLSIFCYLILNNIFNKPAYCWGWDFPLGKRAAISSWEEQPEGEFYAIHKNENDTNIDNGNTSCEDAHYNQQPHIKETELTSADFHIIDKQLFRQHVFSTKGFIDQGILISKQLNAETFEQVNALRLTEVTNQTKQKDIVF